MRSDAFADSAGPLDPDPSERARLLDAIDGVVQRNGRLFVSATVLGGRYTIRATILNFRLKREHVDRAVRLLNDAVT